MANRPSITAGVPELTRFARRRGARGREGGRERVGKGSTFSGGVSPARIHPVGTRRARLNETVVHTARAGEVNRIRPPVVWGLDRGGRPAASAGQFALISGSRANELL